MVALLALTGPAFAQPTCPADVVGCYAEDADWEWQNSLFDTVDFDSGWVPSGSDLQLRFTFVGSLDSGLAPELSAIGIPFITP